MASITTNAVTSGLGRQGAVARAVGHLAGGVAAAWNRGNRRRQLRHLLACEERILHDVGLTRNDVLSAMAEFGRR